MQLPSSPAEAIAKAEEEVSWMKTRYPNMLSYANESYSGSFDFMKWATIVLRSVPYSLTCTSTATPKLRTTCLRTCISPSYAVAETGLIGYSKLSIFLNSRA